MTNLSAVKGNLVTSFLVAAVIFILINSLLTTLAHWIERRVAGRSAAPGATALANLTTDPEEEYADAR
jgi:glutamate transport system permease protein